MRRSPELASLSRDHHVALAHALKLRRASDDDVSAVTAAFLSFLREHGRVHFGGEERVLLPELPADAAALGRRVVAEHQEILGRGAALGARPEVSKAREVGELLDRHVRFEERELFPVLEARLDPERLRDVARRLESAAGEPGDQHA